MFYRRPDVDDSTPLEDVPVLEHTTTPEYDAQREQFDTDETHAHAELWVEHWRTANNGRWWKAAEVHVVQVLEHDRTALLDKGPMVRRFYLLAGPLPAGDVIWAGTAARMVRWPSDAISDRDVDAYRAWLAWNACDRFRNETAVSD